MGICDNVRKVTTKLQTPAHKKCILEMSAKSFGLIFVCLLLLLFFGLIYFFFFLFLASSGDFFGMKTRSVSVLSAPCKLIVHLGKLKSFNLVIGKRLGFIVLLISQLKPRMQISKAVTLI